MLTKSDLRDRTALSVSTFVLGRMKETAGTGNSWNTSLKDLLNKLLSRVSQLDVAGLHRSCGRSTSQHERCVTHRRVNKDSRRQNDKTMVKVDNEFKMNWLHDPTWREKDPFFTGASQRQCLRGATRGRCVSGARVQRRQGLPKKR